MTAPPAIVAQDLGKKYTLRHQRAERYTALRDVLANGAKRLVHGLRDPFRKRRHEAEREEFWALKGVEFEVHEGERLGIIGRNGAGKSTLLKILSRITEPTTGRVTIRGRVASLLEVGTGFHPELTGRENIFLNGAILGMSKATIKRQFDDIVAFAEVEKFLDTPVKRYSSGMYVRLAFAVAAHLEPDILVVDEVLAVGDAQFQKKCLGKMEDIGASGRTVLFVSHNMAAVKAFCNQAMLLDHGRVVALGEVDEVSGRYLAGGGGTKRRHHFVAERASTSETKAELLEVIVCGPRDTPTADILIDQAFAIHFTWRLNVAVPFLRFGVDIVDRSGVVVLSSVDTDTTPWLGQPREPGVFRETVKIPAFLLMPGHYSLRVFAGMPRIERIFEINDVVEFEINDHRSHLTHVTNVTRAGYISTPLHWSVEAEHVP